MNVRSQYSGLPFIAFFNSLGKSAKVEQRALKIHRAISDKWLITEGFKPGDRLIVNGMQKVRPGNAVKVVPSDAGRKNGVESGKTTQAAPKSN